SVGGDGRGWQQQQQPDLGGDSDVGGGRRLLGPGPHLHHHRACNPPRRQGVLCYMILISSSIRSSLMAVVFSMTELMLMGFISLILTVTQGLISKICVPKSVGDSWHPCKPGDESATTSADGHWQDSSTKGRRRLLQDSVSAGVFRRILAGGGGSDKCAAKVRFRLSDLYTSPLSTSVV
ncbi:hypothetical protein GW17_00030634, partial [Ensete ventricosum]